MKFMFILSTLLLSSNHPISIISIIIISAIYSVFLINFLFKNSFVPLIFMLIMLGGMLILFIYMASLSSNEPFKWNMVFMILPFIFFMNMKNITYYSPTNTIFMEKIMKINYNTNIIFSLIYLLISLLIIIELISIFKSPLRSK